jgi:hypothetical protein
LVVGRWWVVRGKKAVRGRKEGDRGRWREGSSKETGDTGGTGLEAAHQPKQRPLRAPRTGGVGRVQGEGGNTGGRDTGRGCRCALWA